MENINENYFKINTSLYSNTKLSYEKIGLIYRKLRKFKEMNEEYNSIDLSHAQNDEQTYTGSKRKKKENIILLPPSNNNEKCIDLGIDKEKLRSSMTKDSNNHPQSHNSGEILIENKPLERKDNIKPYDDSKRDKIIKEINLFEKEFKEKWKDTFRQKVNSYNAIKKNKNLFPKLKFNKKDVVIDKITFPHETFFINFEKLIIDIVLMFNKNNEKLFNNETKNVGSYLLFYLCKLHVKLDKEISNKFLNTYKEIFEYACEKFELQNLRKLKNPINEFYLKSVGLLKKIAKSLRNQYSKFIKLICMKNEISHRTSKLDLHLTNELNQFTNNFENIKKLRYVDFDAEGLDSFYFNNPNYLNLAIRNSKTLSQIRIHIFASLAESKLKEIEEYKTRMLLIIAEEKLFNKIANNHIFKENTIDLITDFLE